MIKTVYRSNRVFENKDKTATASVVYEIGEMKSSIDTSFAVVANDEIIEVVCTFDEAMQSINKNWEQVKIEAVNKSIDKELKEKHLMPSHDVNVSVCACEMPAKIKGKNECWRCKKPFKEFLQAER
jgi:hypothetical protein